jgi:hypothetical protein
VRRSLSRPSSRAREVRALMVRIALRHGVPLTIADVELESAGPKRRPKRATR